MAEFFFKQLPEPRKVLMNGSIHMNGVIAHKEPSRQTKPPVGVDISQEISKAVQSLKNDIELLSNKVTNIERRSQVAGRSKAISLKHLSPQLLTFLVVWPFVAVFITNKFLNRRKWEQSLTL